MYWKRNICHLAGASFEADRARAETVRNTHVVAISGRLEDRRADFLGCQQHVASSSRPA
jgi:hypothetical protein